MKVIYLITKLQKGLGPINQAYNLGTAMKALGADFTIVCISPEIEGRSWQGKFEAAGIPVVHLDKSGKDVVGTIRALKQYVTDNGIDIVHSSGLRPDFYNVALGRRVKHYTTQRCEPCNIMEKSNKVVAALSANVMMWCLKRMDKVIACSKALETHLGNECGLECTHVQNGVDVDYFKPLTDAEKKEVREQLGLPSDKIIYLYCGMFYERKDLHTLLRGFKEMTDTRRVLVVAGGSPEEVERYSTLYNSPNILYLGQKNEPLKYIQCADFNISASLSEGLPNSALESLACGVPVVLSDIGPHRELMETGNIGELFAIKDVAGMMSAIERAESRDYASMCDACVKAVENHFSKYVTAKGYLRKYCE